MTGSEWSWRNLAAPIRTAILCLVAVALMMAASGAALAQEDQSSDRVEILAKVVEETRLIEEALDRGRLNAKRIEEFRAQLEGWHKTLREAAGQLQAELTPLRAELQALGPAPAEGTTEPPVIAESRQRINERIAPLDGRAKRIQATLTYLQSLAERLVEFRRERFTQLILERKPTPVSAERITAAWVSVSNRAKTVFRETRARLDDEGTGVLFDRLALALFLALSAFGLAFWLRRRLVKWLHVRALDEMETIQRARLTAAVTLIRLILPSLGIALIVLGARESALLGPNGEIALQNLAMGAICIVAAYAFGGAFFAPRARGLRVSGLSDWRAKSGFRWYVVLAIVVAFEQMVVAAGGDMRLTADAVSVMNAFLLVPGGFALWKLVHTIGIGQAPRAEDDPDGEAEPAAEEEGRRAAKVFGTLARVLLSFVAVVAPLLALAGYFTASRFLFFPMVYTFALIGVATVIYLWVVAMSTPAQKVHEDDGETVEPRLSAVPVITGFTLTFLVLPALAVIWGAKATDLSRAWSLVTDGFAVGDFTISPMDFFVFGFVFAIGFFVTRTIQGVMRRSVMPILRIDEGAKAALLAGMGYIGVTVSALIAISTTGLDLSNLAIVAGALSVGIGFGLQNVVNNFVSGVILLIERPIKVGDWVEINGSHGMVRRINVRSTQIQKFDRSTMFVPNADLISGTVTNWYYGEGQGRLELTVGVAYGTDVRKVEQILLEAAAAHPMVLRTPAPFVVFRDFGASSLDFELRGIMADVNMILTLPSELRYTIYRRFNEEGIEIPFAQRDITIRNIGEMRGAGGSND